MVQFPYRKKRLDFHMQRNNQPIGGNADIPGALGLPGFGARNCSQCSKRSDIALLRGEASQDSSRPILSTNGRLLEVNAQDVS